MTTDPAPYILAAALLGGAIGFFGCSLYAARRIIEETRDSYWEGYAAANRENEAHNDHQYLIPHHQGIGCCDVSELRSDENRVLADSSLHFTDI